MIELERVCLLNTHNVPAPIKHRKSMRPALRALLTSEIELDNHNFGLTERTAGFSLPIQHLLRPRISALPSRPSPQAALWGVLGFASQLLSLSDRSDLCVRNISLAEECKIYWQENRLETGNLISKL